MKILFCGISYWHMKTPRRRDWVVQIFTHPFIVCFIHIWCTVREIKHKNTPTWSIISNSLTSCIFGSHLCLSFPQLLNLNVGLSLKAHNFPYILRIQPCRHVTAKSSCWNTEMQNVLRRQHGRTKSHISAAYNEHVACGCGMTEDKSMT